MACALALVGAACTTSASNIQPLEKGSEWSGWSTPKENELPPGFRNALAFDSLGWRLYDRVGFTWFDTSALVQNILGAETSPVEWTEALVEKFPSYNYATWHLDLEGYRRVYEGVENPVIDDSPLENSIDRNVTESDTLEAWFALAENREMKTKLEQIGWIHDAIIEQIAERRGQRKHPYLAALFFDDGSRKKSALGPHNDPGWLACHTNLRGEGMEILGTLEDRTVEEALQIMRSAMLAPNGARSQLRRELEGGFILEAGETVCWQLIDLHSLGGASPQNGVMHAGPEEVTKPRLALTTTYVPEQRASTCP